LRSSVFTSTGLKKHLVKQETLSRKNAQLETVWSKDRVFFCEPSLGKPQHVVGYLGQYTNRVAISNNRILDVNDREVRFLSTDYHDKANVKPARLNGAEFLRRFCSCLS
jgi:hypothetical protein